MRRAFFYAVRPIQNCLPGMFTMISLACLVGGVGLATLSLRRPDHAASLEREAEQAEAGQQADAEIGRAHV